MAVTKFKQYQSKSARNRRANKCGTKVRYKDHTQAIGALHLLTNRRNSDLRQFGETTFNQTRVYQCDRCAGWHLATSEFWDSRRKAA
jgi:hypothetical protein